MHLRVAAAGAGLRHWEESAGANRGHGVGQEIAPALADGGYTFSRTSEIPPRADAFSRYDAGKSGRNARAGKLRRASGRLRVCDH